MSNKTSDNVANIEEDVKILNNFCEYEDAVVLTDYALTLVQEAIEHILADREQKDKRIKELEEKNKHLSNVSDYETISLECVHLEEQLEIANSRIQELEEERNHWHGCFIVVMENSIAKEKVKDKIEELDIAILECEYDDDDVEEYKNDVEKEKRILLIKKSALEELLEEK